MKSSFFINHLEKFSKDEILRKENFDELVRIDIEENNKKIISFDNINSDINDSNNNNVDDIILKKEKKRKKKKIEQIRNTLSSNCRVIEINDDEEIKILDWNNIKSTKINEYIINSLITKFHFNNFLACQSNVLEYLLLYKYGSSCLKSGDIYIEVPTGLGKTLCYIISIIDYFLYKNENTLYCLILTATDELVNQIMNVINIFEIKNLKCMNIDMKNFHSNIYFDEIINHKKMLSDCNILVTTTKKFEGLFYSNEDIFMNLKFVIIDEVDKIVAYSQCNICSIVNSLTYIVKKHQNNCSNIYKPKYFLQKILVSATLCKVSDNLMSLDLYRPIFFYYILNYKRNEEFYFFTKNKYSKMYILIKLLLNHIPNKDMLSMLIFCGDEDSSHTLYRYLTIYFSYNNNNNYSIKEYSRQLSNKVKKKILTNFLNQKVHILICNDNISRGLDTVNVNYVINFDMPKHYNVLTHRIGRLARYNSRRGTVYHFIKKSENIIMNKSAKQRNVNLIEQKRFKKNTLIDIKNNIMNLKKIVKNTIHMERKEKIKPHKFYSYDELIKLIGT
ncbi:ATP-dependent RNA helicase, putative [Plasmodium gaboni]|uniref:ATP-dependent RNA helicase n=1 Tax=Plasmodium gaboni TaxID=647221 RepID=A0ABY1UIH6_9APIC|nr:ATP-dependent RNA helicase, putative [Plasmodium gaboni]